MSSWEQVVSVPWNPTNVPPTFVTVGSRRNIWGANGSGDIFQWRERNGWWEAQDGETPVPGASCQPIAAAADGSVFCINDTSNVIYKWNDGGWESIGEPSSAPLAQVAAGSKSNVWVRDTNGNPFKYDGSSWTSISVGIVGPIGYISVAQDGTVFAIITSNDQPSLYQYTGSGLVQWVKLLGNTPNLAQIAAVNVGVTWGITRSGSVQLRRNGTWGLVGGDLTTISAASDNTVWGTMPGAEGTVQIVRFCSCPPVGLSQLSLAVDPDSSVNYGTLEANAANGWGLTGLMVVSSFQDCHGNTVQPGMVYLFPGISVAEGTTPAPYSGASQLSLNCQSPAPLVNYVDDPDSQTLHAQMCSILGARSDYFIGFSINGYPWVSSTKSSSDPHRLNIGFNSGTCNVRWFGSREIPNCICTNHVNWRNQIIAALASGSPSAL